MKKHTLSVVAYVAPESVVIDTLEESMLCNSCGTNESYDNELDFSFDN